MLSALGVLVMLPAMVVLKFRPGQKTLPCMAEKTVPVIPNKVNPATLKNVLSTVPGTLLVHSENAIVLVEVENKTRLELTMVPPLAVRTVPVQTPISPIVTPNLAPLTVFGMNGVPSVFVMQLATVVFKCKLELRFLLSMVDLSVLDRTATQPRATPNLVLSTVLGILGDLGPTVLKSAEVVTKPRQERRTMLEMVVQTVSVQIPPGKFVTTNLVLSTAFGPNGQRCLPAQLPVVQQLKAVPELSSLWPSLVAWNAPVPTSTQQTVINLLALLIVLGANGILGESAANLAVTEHRPEPESLYPRKMEVLFAMDRLL